MENLHTTHGLVQNFYNLHPFLKYVVISGGNRKGIVIIVIIVILVVQERQ